MELGLRTLRPRTGPPMPPGVRPEAMVLERATEGGRAIVGGRRTAGRDTFTGVGGDVDGRVGAAEIADWGCFRRG